MEPLGAELRAAREQKHLTLSKVASDTRIGATHLANLEAGRYQALPGGIYNRAFLRAYCDYLGLDAQIMLDRYQAETSPPAERPAKPKPRMRTLEPRITVSPVAVWSLMLLASVVGLFLSRKWISGVFSPYFTGKPVTAPVTTKAAAADHSQESVTPAAADASLSSSENSLQAADASLPPPAPGAMRLRLEMTQRCWVSVTSDGNRVLVKLLEPGETQTFDAMERFYLILGNAGGVRATIDGKPAKPFGRDGEVVKVLINQQILGDLLEQPSG